MKSTEFSATVEVRQDCILGPLQFIILMDGIVKECNRDTKSFDMGNWQMKPVKISELATVNDLVLLLKSEEDMKLNLNTCIWNREMEMKNMTLSINKS
jgi:hypothetical protein